MTEDAIRVWRRHNCKSRHKRHRAMARCIWPEAGWIRGEGRYATVSYCQRRWYASPTVHLHKRLEAAQAALEIIDRLGCGGNCERKHRVVELALPEEKE